MTNSWISGNKLTRQPSALIVAAFVCLSAQANAGQPKQPIDKCAAGEEIEPSGSISGGVDGDTVRLQTQSGTYSVRLLGIDTPEKNFMGKSQGVWAEKASAAMQEMLPVGTKVKLEFGETPCDSHGRVLAQIFKTGKPSLHVNGEILKMGLAVNYCVAPEFRYCEDFSRFVQRSIDNGTGMFADPKVELPYDFRRRIGKNEQRSFVGSVQTKVVYGPGNQEKTPTADRVFFYSREDVKSPYQIAE
jgi:endonuclease YncB( thermonuclease family)